MPVTVIVFDAAATLIPAPAAIVMAGPVCALIDVRPPPPPVAGWNVGKNRANTSEVRQELEISHQPTPSTKGYADYALFGEDGKPIAVVEAKRTAVDPEDGRTQAKLYADGLEKQYRIRPFIYYTNGYDIWFWNDAAKEPPRKVYGFHSRDSLQYRRFQLAEREPRSKVAPSVNAASALPASANGWNARRAAAMSPVLNNSRPRCNSAATRSPSIG